MIHQFSNLYYFLNNCSYLISGMNITTSFFEFRFQLNLGFKVHSDGSVYAKYIQDDIQTVNPIRFIQMRSILSLS